jgi:hypothetical protein
VSLASKLIPELLGYEGYRQMDLRFAVVEVLHRTGLNLLTPDCVAHWSLAQCLKPFQNGD